ncbi:hypothetical protein PRIPAC_74582 [Pristionchus pacificus]|uniref:Uncharacterized protein n=1 Tax=Pristionchus pacificus TaxID=54126 RepID=A0A2A6C7A7_PRIPA|nr:hypothetical protein PRIPAC_74582 [Pristionchus pacificus]|eukprot:PDM74092.1 hypothetical protein PRIPAC_41448 [Pristionchus pacificus]
MLSNFQPVNDLEYCSSGKTSSSEYEWYPESRWVYYNCNFNKPTLQVTSLHIHSPMVHVKSPFTTAMERRATRRKTKRRVLDMAGKKAMD